jgi:hypothetical protein
VFSGGLPANLTPHTQDPTSADAANKAAAYAPVIYGKSNAIAQKATTDTVSQTANTLTAAIPPVVPKEIPKSTAVSNAVPSTLSSDSYAFFVFNRR